MGTNFQLDDTKYDLSPLINQFEEEKNLDTFVRSIIQSPELSQIIPNLTKYFESFTYEVKSGASKKFVHKLVENFEFFYNILATPKSSRFGLIRYYILKMMIAMLKNHITSLDAILISRDIFSLSIDLMQTYNTHTNLHNTVVLLILSALETPQGCKSVLTQSSILDKLVFVYQQNFEGITTQDQYREKYQKLQSEKKCFYLPQIFKITAIILRKCNPRESDLDSFIKSQFSSVYFPIKFSVDTRYCKEDGEESAMEWWQQ